MGFLDKLLGADEPEKEKAGAKDKDAKEAREARDGKGRDKDPPARGEKVREGDPRVAHVVPVDSLLQVFQALIERLDRLDQRTELVATGVAQVAQLAPMVQFMAKGAEKNDRALRAHFTTELDKLGASLRLDAARQGALDVFKVILPALDDIDHVLREAAEPPAGLPMVQKKLKDAFARLGIEEITIEEGVTHFDGEVHEGEPFKGDPEKAKGLARGTIVRVERAGYRVQGGNLIRASKVLVVSQEP